MKYRLLALVVILSFSASLFALSVGTKVSAVRVTDGVTPDVGKKVLSIFYTDPDKKDMNEPIREALKAAKFDKKKYRGYGVVNAKDTWLANAIIRSVVRGKRKKYNSTILMDENHILKKAWNLGTVNNRDVVIILDKTGRVRYYNNNSKPLSASQRQQVVNLVRKLVNQ